MHMAADTPGAVYTSRLQKGGALLPEMRTLVRLWREGADIETITSEVEQNNLLGKASRTRVRDVLKRTFLPRYVQGQPPNAWRYLRPFEDAGAPPDVVRPLYYFYAARSEPLMADFVRGFLHDRYHAGLTDVTVIHAIRFIEDAEADGRIPAPWSESVKIKVARGLLAALRDFGVLSGKVNKRITPPYLPPVAFAHVAFWLAHEHPGERALQHPDWRLYLMLPEQVERAFIAANQAGLLHYDAAGTIVRIEFPEEDMDAYCRFLAAQAH